MAERAKSLGRVPESEASAVSASNKNNAKYGRCDNS